MDVVSRAPSDSRLRRLVDRVWWTASDPTAETVVEWVLPTCRAQVILAAGASVLAGPKVASERIERRSGTPVVGVSIAAGAVPAFFGVGGDDVLGTTEALDSLWSSGSLAERLAEQSGDRALDEIEAALVERVRSEWADERVLTAALAIRAGGSAADVVARLVVDRRSFVPGFRRAVGAAPKFYERVCRFNRTVASVRRADAAPLASIAVAHGYADQSHLSREIREFAATSPSLLHGDGSHELNHVASDKIFTT